MKKILLHVFVLTLFVFANILVIDYCTDQFFSDDAITMNDFQVISIDEDVPSPASVKNRDFELPALRTLSATHRYKTATPESFKFLSCQAFVSIFAPPPNLA